MITYRNDRIKLVFWLSMVVFILSCHHACDDEQKPPVSPECSIDSEFPLGIIWSSLLRPDSSRGGSMKPALYENDVLFNNGPLGMVNTIYSLSPDDGIQKWEWDQFLEPPGDFSTIYRTNATQVFENKFYFDHGNFKMLLDVAEKQLIWGTDAGFSESEQVRLGDYLYYVGYISNGGIIQGSRLFRLHKDATIDSWELVYELQGGHILGIPALWTNPKGEEILLSKSTVLTPTRTYFVGYNLTLEKQEFILENFTEYEKSKFPPLVYEDKAYLPLFQGITCVDLISLQVLWETENIGNNFFIQTNPILQDGVIIIHSYDPLILALDANNGSKLWTTGNTGSAPANIEYYQGGIYYCGNEDFNGYLYGLDFQTGTEFLKTESPYIGCFPTVNMNGYISIDQETGRLYTTDGMHAYCFQLEPQ